LIATLIAMIHYTLVDYDINHLKLAATFFTIALISIATMIHILIKYRDEFFSKRSLLHKNGL
jgi:hypothetical protein